MLKLIFYKTHKHLENIENWIDDHKYLIICQVAKTRIELFFEKYIHQLQLGFFIKIQK